MGNYDNIHGVQYTRFDGDENEPSVETYEATVDEMYWQHGEFVITFDVNDSFHRLKIPIKAMDKWDEFVNSLPTWQG